MRRGAWNKAHVHPHADVILTYNLPTCLLAYHSITKAYYVPEMVHGCIASLYLFWAGSV